MKLNEYKDIIKQAIANEVEAKKFYEDAANTLKDPHLKKLFASLAEEEKKHRDILTKIYTSNTMDRYFSESRDYKVAETVDEPELSMADEAGRCLCPGHEKGGGGHEAVHRDGRDVR